MSNCKTVTDIQLVRPNHDVYEMNRRLSTGDGSARAIIRSLESGLARAVAIPRLKHDGPI